eukprot:1158689-Pelagomonas_calceolata.AAC.17
MQWVEHTPLRMRLPSSTPVSRQARAEEEHERRTGLSMNEQTGQKPQNWGSRVKSIHARGCCLVSEASGERSCAHATGLAREGETFYQYHGHLFPRKALLLPKCIYK